VEGELGKRFWWKTAGIVIGLGILGLVGFLLMSRLVYRFGVIGALIAMFGILMIFMYRHDKKEQHKYDDLPD
jgi:hypothetical protein